jgi:hypothetical protein
MTERRLAAIVSAGESVSQTSQPSPVWVKRSGFVMSAVCPVYPQLQTFPEPVSTSHLCQQETSPKSTTRLDHCAGRFSVSWPRDTLANARE